MTATEEFHRLATTIVDRQLEADPVAATSLGDHRFDGRLADLSAVAVASRVTAIDDDLTALDAVDDLDLALADQVDLEILRAALLKSRFELDELREHTWNPRAWNPGTALHLLLAREFAPPGERRESLRRRLEAIPDSLADARGQLGEMPRVHVETAMQQVAGTARLVDGDVRSLAVMDDVVDRALSAITGFGAWLGDRLPEAHRSPRLGDRLYEAALWHGLDTGEPGHRLEQEARGHLDRVTWQMQEVAAEYLGVAQPAPEVVRAALDEIARRAPVSDETVLPLMREAIDRTTSFVLAADLVSIPDVDVRIIEMPEIHRGVAVAYCDAPGPLEQARVATYVAVAPTPVGWDTGRVASFYREYNGVQLHGLAVHEAMPGHVLQLAHSRALATATPVRRYGRSGVFVEGWAVYAEELMVDRGYAPDGHSRAALALRLQQLKMQARGAINAILDVSVHTGDMAQAEGIALMRDRGFQEEGEAVGKWRRALLTAGQLPTYFAGYREVSRIVGDLRVLHADWSDRRLHDLVLSQGSPAPRHLRTLLGI